MNITFLIGNGFDVGLGLATRYSDFYKTLDPNSTNRIEKDIVEKTQNKEVEDLYWKDYELGLGKITKNYSDKEFVQFRKDKSEMDHKIAAYIKVQEMKYRQNTIDENCSNFKENLMRFHRGLNKRHFDELTSKFSQAGDYHFGFISFNYTSILDKYITAMNICHTSDDKRFKFSAPLHIHGEVENGYIVALDNQQQIENQQMAVDRDMQNYLIKPKINAFLGGNKTELATAAIKSSDIICVFGMSMGETDRMWWIKIREWLKVANKILIIYDYDRNANYISGSDYVDYITQVRHRFLAASECTDEESIKAIFDKIYVIHNSNIFNFRQLEAN